MDLPPVFVVGARSGYWSDDDVADGVEPVRADNKAGAVFCGFMHNVIPIADTSYLASSHMAPSGGSSMIPSEASAAYSSADLSSSCLAAAIAHSLSPCGLLE